MKDWLSYTVEVQPCTKATCKQHSKPGHVIILRDFIISTQLQFRVLAAGEEGKELPELTRHFVTNKLEILSEIISSYLKNRITIKMVQQS